ncbi:MAG: DUF305 domain-containing protein [Actinomycetota bacterium]|nr:DUF305 domain-containing protein [Actinomycetota bacterium]
MKLRTLALASSALVIALALAGCSSSQNGMGMGSDSGRSSTPSSASSFNDPDIAFATQMIPHHEQAVEMADLILAKTGVDSRVTDLAKKIKAAQEPEIVIMTDWLTSWGQPSPMPMDGMTMNGMMSQDDMDALKNGSGLDSSKLFLQQMIQHHQGALDMAKEELTTGKNAEALALAKRIVTNQTDEIATMKSLLTSF